MTAGALAALAGFLFCCISPSRIGLVRHTHSVQNVEGTTHAPIHLADPMGCLPVLYCLLDDLGDAPVAGRDARLCPA